MSWFEGDKCLKSSHIIQYEPSEHDSTQPGLREILVDHEQIVTEIEVGLAWIVIGKCASTEVIDGTLRHACQLVTPHVQSPAEVDLLHVSKELIVESAQFVVEFRSDKERGSADPERTCDGIVLSVVGCDKTHHSASAEGVAEPVDTSSCSSGVLEGDGLCGIILMSE